MELLESTYFQIWVGIGVACAIWLAITEGSSVFDMKPGGEFKDDEFSMGYFIFIVLLGPITLAVLVFYGFSDLIKMPGEMEREKAYHLELEKQKEEERKREEEERKREEEERKRKKEEKRQFKII